MNGPIWKPSDCYTMTDALDAAVIRRGNLTPRIKGSQRVSAPIGVEPARRITPAQAQAPLHGMYRH